MLKFVVLIVIIQLFYGFGVTVFSYTLPADQLINMNSFSAPTDDLDVTGISETLEQNIQSQINMPIVDIGSLVFHSGNILLDMLINFFTAIPSMITVLFSAFFMMFPVDAYLAAQIKLLFWVIASIIYFVAFLTFILSIRSIGSGGVV